MNIVVFAHLTQQLSLGQLLPSLRICHNQLQRSSLHVSNSRCNLLLVYGNSFHIKLLAGRSGSTFLSFIESSSLQAMCFQCAFRLSANHRVPFYLSPHHGPHIQHLFSSTEHKQWPWYPLHITSQGSKPQKDTNIHEYPGAQDEVSTAACTS